MWNAYSMVGVSIVVVLAIILIIKLWGWPPVFLFITAVGGLYLARLFLHWSGCLCEFSWLPSLNPVWGLRKNCSWAAAAPFLTGPPFFVVWMTRFLHKKADIKTERLTERNQRYTRIVDQLAKTVTYGFTTPPSKNPNPNDEKEQENLPHWDVRMGALHALEKLMKEAPEEYHRIGIKTLCAYIKNNDGRVHRKDGGMNPVVQVALDILARRRCTKHDKKEKVDLTRANLIGANLKEAKLKGAVLIGAFLCDTTLEDANLKKADLAGAILTNANLKGAQLQKAELRDVKWWRKGLSQAERKFREESKEGRDSKSRQGATLAWGHAKDLTEQQKRVRGGDCAYLKGAKVAGATIKCTPRNYAALAEAIDEPNWVDKNGNPIKPT